jgi:hypothetical protein
MSLITTEGAKKFPFYKAGSAASFGWLKRAELGTSELEIWEAPSGEQFSVKHGYMLKIAIFTPPPGSYPEDYQR